MASYLESIKEQLSQRPLIDFNIDLDCDYFHDLSLSSVNININGKVDRKNKKALLIYTFAQESGKDSFEVYYADNTKYTRDYYKKGEWHKESYSPEDFTALFSEQGELVPLNVEAFEQLKDQAGTKGVSVRQGMGDDNMPMEETSNGIIRHLGAGLFKVDLLSSRANDESRVQLAEKAEVVISLPEDMTIRSPV